MVSSTEVGVNLRRTEALLAEVNLTEVDAIFLPENFAALGHPKPIDVARQSSLEIEAFLAEKARELDAWMFAGTQPLLTRANGTTVPGDRVRAASLVLDGAGVVQARYDKIHMFDVDVADEHRHYRESNTFEHGDSLQVVDTPWAKVGLSVCYDIRFSELYLALFKSGAEVFAIPSAFTVPTGGAHFEVLMRARAIESFAFTVAACQGGSHDSGRETYGHSMVVNPWGEVIAEAGRGEAVLIVDLDMGEVEKARSELPVTKQRQL